MATHIVGHLPHQLGRDLVEHMLQVNNAAGPGFEIADALLKILWKSYIREHAKIRGVEETQASLSLCLPELAVGVDDTISFRR